ncbi:MAG TPA: sigma-54 dependent transcriptional regulator, partial [Candidatus Acidoferrales bacterium]|nr:sigma-54 dependent transcriptional regulator [Candidatus Acidoferrales bacterium]
MSLVRVDWVAEDPASRRVLELAERVAPAGTTLLITGESGTGKDQLARFIHESGPRRDAPYQKIDCASLPPELVESELFGHERGAFTGAEEAKRGRLELAGRGTLVLDEVAALGLPVQAKLLRVVEDRHFEHLGGTESLRMDARIIALTNANLDRAVAEHRFRADLFFRLNVLAIDVPPLRTRPADVIPLAHDILRRLGPVHGRPEARLDAEAEGVLIAYSWPGNVRELKNALERALVFAQQDVLGADDLPESLRASASRAPGNSANLRSLEQIEREAIAATLEATRYKITRAAQILGISRKTLL